MGVRYDEKSCGIVLFRIENGKRLYLLLHYPGGHWDLAKGHIEKGEEEKETATRELLEETGISDPVYIKGFREHISYRYYKKGKLSNKEVIFYLARTELKEVKISHEHRDHLWLPYDSAYKKLTFENAKNLVKKSEKFLS